MSAAAEALRAAPQLDTDWVESDAGFEALAAEWDALVDDAAVPHPFVLHAWLLTWWQAFGGGAALRVLTVRAQGRLVGAAALMLVEERLYGLRMRTLKAIAGDHTPRFDVLVHPSWADDVYDAMWEAIAARDGDWDLVTIRDLPEDSPTLDALASRARAAGHATGTWAADESPYVTFNGAWNRYHDSLSYNHRRNVGKGRRRLERKAPVVLDIVTDGDVEARIRDGMRIEARAWKARAGTAMASRAALRRFYLTVGRRLAERGRLRLHFLRYGGEPIAFSFGILYRDTIFVLKGGYEPRYAKYTPYNVMCGMVLEDGFARGLRGYDFLGGSDPWKRQWARQVRKHHWLYVCSKRVHARCVHFIKFHVLPAVRGVFERTG